MSTIIIDSYKFAPPPSGSFPSVLSTADDQQNSSATDWGVMSMPAGVVSGDPLFMAVACDGPNRNISATNSGAVAWTELAQIIGANSATLEIFYKTAEGGGDDDPTIGISGAEQGACRIWRFDPLTVTAFGTQPPEADNGRGGNSATLLIDGLTPTGGAKDYLWMALAAFKGADLTIDNGPTNYTSGSNKGGTTNPGCHLAWGLRELNASTEDPDDFDASAANHYQTCLVAIHPA